MHWRLNDYFNPGLVTDGGAGQHLLDTEYTTQDHDLTLFPQSNLKFFLGYSRGNQNGPAISTVQLFDSRGNEFPLFENVRRVRNEYRVGNEIRVLRRPSQLDARLGGFQGRFQLSLWPKRGQQPSQPNHLNFFPAHRADSRNQPLLARRPCSPIENISAPTDASPTPPDNRAFVLDETAIGTARFGAADQPDHDLRQRAASGLGRQSHAQLFSQLPKSPSRTKPR